MTIKITSDGTALPPTTCSAGPTHCDICGEWPARQTERGKRCHMCETREWCNEHPVPLPSNPETVKELVDLGYDPTCKETRLPDGKMVGECMTDTTPTPTPRTDAFISGIQSGDLQAGGQLIALSDFARTLERELAETRALAAEAEVERLRGSEPRVWTAETIKDALAD